MLIDDGDLLRYVQRAGIRRLALYGLGHVLDAPGGAASLARFCTHARAAGISWIAAPVSHAERVDALSAFVRAYPTAHFDALITESEYWHDEADRAAAFGRFVALLQRMRAFARDARTHGHRVTVGVYLGYPTDDEIAVLARHVDFAWLNYNVPEPRGNWRAARLQSLRRAGIETWPILYVRGDTHMGPWLAAHGMRAAEAAFVRSAGTTMPGFAYFAYPTVAHITPRP